LAKRVAAVYREHLRTLFYDLTILLQRVVLPRSTGRSRENGRIPANPEIAKGRRPTLGAFTYVHNMIAYDYPFEESVESVIDVVDEFVICECASTDETPELVERLRAKYPTKIKVVHRDWVKHFNDISRVANFAMSHLTTDYAMQLQADEVVHENSLSGLLQAVQMLASSKKTGIRVHYTHFMANYETTFPFCYDALVRVVKMNTPWHIIGDGVQFGYTAHIFPEYKTLDCPEIMYFHYGKVKDPEKGWQKEWDFQQLYTDIGFPDPKMKEMAQQIGQKVDYVYLFEDHVQRGTINRFTGTHPSVMRDRISRFKAGGFEQFVSRVRENVRITFPSDGG